MDQNCCESLVHPVLHRQTIGTDSLMQPCIESLIAEYEYSVMCLFAVSRAPDRVHAAGNFTKETIFSRLVGLMY